VTDELVRVAVDDGVATITLDSPANRNALSKALVAGMAPTSRNEAPGHRTRRRSSRCCVA
jgi:hypothetical protein